MEQSAWLNFCAIRSAKDHTEATAVPSNFDTLQGLSLTALGLESTGISDFGREMSGVNSIAKSLAVNCTLTSLDMSLNQLDDSFAALLANSLLLNNTLTILDLDRTAISAESARDLVKASARVGKQDTLTSLHLDQSIILDMLLLPP
jgi:hypothetical protein